jgi:hypothetical protein
MVLIHYIVIDILIVPLNSSNVYHILEMFVVGIIFGGLSLFVEGIQKLLCHLNPYKATGPDQVSPRLLKEPSKQISPELTLVFQASINQGKIPEEWKSSNITKLFKKGDRSTLVNYVQCR